MLVQPQQPGGVAPSRHRCCCTACAGILLTIFAILAISGAAVIFTASSVDPEADFKQLSGECTIKFVDINLETQYHDERNSRRESCDQIHSFKFCLPDEGVGCIQYESKELHEEGVCDMACEDARCSAREVKWADGDTTTCWQANYEVDFPYDCGNEPDCYKIYDPADEVEGAIGLGIGLLVPGLLFLILGVVLIQLKCLENCINQMDASDQRSSQQRQLGGMVMAPPMAPAGAPMMLAVTIPQGVGPGSTITVANPHGGTMNVTVPPNTPPGTVIHVQAPQQQPIVMVQVATVQQPPEPIAVTATVVKQGF